MPFDAIESEDSDQRRTAPTPSEPRLASVCPHCGDVYPNGAVMQCSRCGNQRRYEGHLVGADEDTVDWPAPEGMR